MDAYTANRPRWWPHFRSPLRSTAVTARLGRALGICFGVCFVTGMLSHYQYQPWSWLPEPAHPVQAYRVTQGLHVATGVATIPLLLVKLWSVYPNLFRWPPIRSIKHALERLSVFVLVSSALVQLTTGFLNTLNWYPWPWSFPSTHRYLGYVVIGSILLHIAMKLPDIKYGLQARLADADVLTEVPWDENPLAHSNAGTVPPPEMPAMDRRGLFVAVGSGIGAVVLTTVGQTVTPLVAHRVARNQGGLERSAGGPGEQDRQVGARSHSGQGRGLAPRGDGPHALHPDPGRARVDEVGDAALPDQLRRGMERRRGVAGHPGDRPRPARRWRLRLRVSRSSRCSPTALQPQHAAGAPGRGGPARHPPQRRAAQSRPRIPAAADRPQPTRSPATPSGYAGWR